MLRDMPSIIWLAFIGIILIVVTGIYYQNAFKQDSIILGLTETVRTSAIASADNSSRLKPGELFIVQEDFEERFTETIQANKNVKISEDAEYKFEYLKNENGATKAIRVVIQDGERTYQATAKVNIADS